MSTIVYASYNEKELKQTLHPVYTIEQLRDELIQSYVKVCSLRAIASLTRTTPVSDGSLNQ